MTDIRRRFVTPEWIMERFWPGSHDYEAGGHPNKETAWNAEFEDISSRPHFWRILEEMKRRAIEWPPHVSEWEDPVLLGPDWRVLDGHHRILALHIINGMDGQHHIEVEFQGEGPWWEDL